ncbi:MAG: glycosyltransferase family 39 protein [Vicinamibacterales bacterium]
MRRAWLLLLVATLAAAFAVAIGWTGGFDLRIAGARLRSHSWGRPAIAASLALCLWLFTERGRIREMLRTAWLALDSSVAAHIVLAAALAWTIVAGSRFGTFSAGGSDSYGYLSQAHQLHAGRLSDDIPMHSAFTWSNAESTLIPLAHVRAPEPGRMVPTYPPGLPVLMAAVLPAGERAAYLLVPAFGAVLLFFTWRAGRLLGDSLAGAVAALLLSLSPPFLLQLLQPMSDVPAAACWAAAIVWASRTGTRAALLAGISTGLAVMIRPNLGPLAVIVAASIVLTDEHRTRRAIAFFVPAALLTGALLLIQARRYGSPVGSGYGDPGDLFSISNVGTNLRLYSGWITSRCTPVVWLFLAAPIALTRARTLPLFWALAALIAGTWCAYLPYVSFRPEEWFYTRFLLPAIPFMLLLATMVVMAGIRLLPREARPVLVTLFVLVMSLTLARGSRPSVAGIAAQEQRYAAAGGFVRDSLPASSVVLAAQHSGSIRLYSNRVTVRWDLAAAGELDAIVAALRGGGFAPFVVLDAGEVPLFRERFAGQRMLDRLRPLAEFGQARVYSVE